MNEISAYKPTAAGLSSAFSGDGLESARHHQLFGISQSRYNPLQDVYLTQAG